MDVSELEVPFSEEEVKRTVSNYDSFKSLYLDINFSFVNDFWLE